MNPQATERTKVRVRRRVTVAAVQMNCPLGKVEQNRERAIRRLRRLRRRVDIACLPELFTTGYDRRYFKKRLFWLAEPIPGETTEALTQAARELRMALCATLIERGEDGCLYDTAILINRHGELVGRHRKVHLYPLEEPFFTPGERLEVFHLDGVGVGVAICFEMAFPPLFSTLALRGAQVVFAPGAIPVGYEHVLDLRTRARAQDNQIFVVAANHVGREGNAVYCGRSQIADPRGQVLARARRDREQVIVATLDLRSIAQERKREPALERLRPEFYLWEG